MADALLVEHGRDDIPVINIIIDDENVKRRQVDEVRHVVS
jgi:hypothetical protein